MENRIMEPLVKKNKRRPKWLKNNVFVLYQPRRIILRPEDYENI